MAEKNGFVLYHSYSEHMNLLSDEDCGKLFKAIFKYEKSGITPTFTGALAMAFSFIKTQLDMDREKYNATVEKRREAGKRGGRPTIKANGFSEKQIKAKKADKDKDNVNVNVNDKDKEEDKVKDKEEDKVKDIHKMCIIDNGSTNVPHQNKKTKSPKHKYGEYKNVLLTDEEYEKLKKEFPSNYNERIERLSEYIESKGAKYKSHLATIRSWARKETPKENTKSTEEIRYGGTYL